MQDAKWRQQFWNLANQFIGINVDSQNYYECDCDCKCDGSVILIMMDWAGAKNGSQNYFDCRYEHMHQKQDSVSEMLWLFLPFLFSFHQFNQTFIFIMKKKIERR